MRLFAALALPEEAVDRLFALQLRWRSAQDGLRWSAPPQWHITLHFFGEASEAQASCLDRAMAQLGGSACDVVLDSLGVFGTKGILLAVGAPSAELAALQKSVVQLGVACGSPAPSRGFTSHVTMARSRNRTGLQSLARLQVPSLPPFGPPLRWRATECLLLESTLRPGGADYETIHRYALR